jgi:hypothetical protein
MFNNFFFQNRAFCEIRWKNTVEPGRPQMTVWHMRIACWIPKAKNTHSECVMLIAFPLQQCLAERHSALPVLLFFMFFPFLFLLLPPSVNKCRMRRKHRRFGGWILCTDCMVKEFKWGILERVLLFCASLYSCSPQKRIRTVSYTHVRRICVRNYHWVAGIFPELDYWSVLCQKCGK